MCFKSLVVVRHSTCWVCRLHKPKVKLSSCRRVHLSCCAFQVFSCKKYASLAGGNADTPQALCFSAQTPPHQNVQHLVSQTVMWAQQTRNHRVYSAGKLHQSWPPTIACPQFGLTTLQRRLKAMFNPHAYSFRNAIQQPRHSLSAQHLMRQHAIKKRRNRKHGGNMHVGVGMRRRRMHIQGGLFHNLEHHAHTHTHTA